MPPENRRGIANPGVKHPEVGEEIVVCPDLRGGTNWQAVAYSPVTNALYAPSNNTCMRYSLNEVETGETLWKHRQRAGFGGSVLTTAGRLVFVSDDARRFRAFDARTGDVLWEQVLNSTAGGFPVSYAVDGVQYIAAPAGGGPNYLSLTREIRQRPGGNMLFVFRLR